MSDIQKRIYNKQLKSLMQYQFNMDRNQHIDLLIIDETHVDLDPLTV